MSNVSKLPFIDPELLGETAPDVRFRTPAHYRVTITGFGANGDAASVEIHGEADSRRELEEVVLHATRTGCGAFDVAMAKVRPDKDA